MDEAEWVKLLTQDYFQPNFEWPTKWDLSSASLRGLEECLKQHWFPQLPNLQRVEDDSDTILGAIGTAQFTFHAYLEVGKESRNYGLCRGERRWDLGWAWYQGGGKGLLLRSILWSWEKKDEIKAKENLSHKQFHEKYGKKSMRDLEVYTFHFCPHPSWRSVNLGRCYNRYTCNECGYSYEIDSSD